MSDKMIKALDAVLAKFDDPDFVESFKQKIELGHIEKENGLICSVVDANFRVADVGDMIMYGLNHNYYDELQKQALDLFYQFHGQGD